VTRTSAFGVLVLAGSVMLSSCGDNRGGDVPKIRRMFETMPGVRVRDVIGWDEMWPIAGPINIRADIDVGGKGRLVLCNLTPDAFRGKAGFIIARVGRSIPGLIADSDIGRVRNVAGCPNSVDAGPDTPFQKLIPFPVRSIPDVVDNYELLNALIESWPTTSTRITSPDGSWIDYYRSPCGDT